MGPISGEWSHTVYSCAENTPWSSNSWVQLPGTSKGGYCAKLVSLSSCILALSLFHLRWGSPWQPRGQGRFWGRPRPCPGQAWPGWPECGNSAGAGSPHVESCCRLSTTCVVSTWGLLVPFFSLSGDAVPCFFSTSCSRWNPKSITLSEKCL